MNSSIRLWRLLFSSLSIAALLILVPNRADAVCRVIEPISATDGVAFDPTTTVLVVQAPEQVVGYNCGPHTQLPNETPDEPFVPNNPDIPGARRAPPAMDPPPPDPSLCPDGSYGEPIYDTLTHVVMQPSIYARGGRAGLVMPIHRRADVHAGPSDVMRLVQELQDIWVEETLEFVEDSSLGYQCSDPHYAQAELPIPSPLSLYGCGDDSYYRPGLEGGETSVVEYEDGETVEFETIPVSDNYTVTVLSASSVDALSYWMDDHGFAHDEVDDQAFERYVGEDHWFVAIDVHPADLDGEEQALSPLVVTYRGDEFPITHELTYDPDGGIIETELYVLSPERMKIENGDGLVRYAAPFVLDPLADAELDGFGLSEGWLTHIQMERQMSDILQLDTRLVVDEESAGETVDWVIERVTRIRIAQACCGGNTLPDQDASSRMFIESRRYRLGERPSDDTLFYSAPEIPEAFCPGGASYDEPEYGAGYGCSVAGATASWSPLLLALFLSWRRKRRVRRA